MKKHYPIRVVSPPPGDRWGTNPRISRHCSPWWGSQICCPWLGLRGGRRAGISRTCSSNRVQGLGLQLLHGVPLQKIGCNQSTDARPANWRSIHQYLGPVKLQTNCCPSQLPHKIFSWHASQGSYFTIIRPLLKLPALFRSVCSTSIWTQVGGMSTVTSLLCICAHHKPNLWSSLPT